MCCQEDAKKKFEQVDVSTSKCFKEEDRQKLLGVVEQGFGSFFEFNEIIRNVFSERVTHQDFSIFSKIFGPPKEESDGAEESFSRSSVKILKQKLFKKANKKVKPVGQAPSPEQETNSIVKSDMTLASFSEPRDINSSNNIQTSNNCINKISNNKDESYDREIDPNINTIPEF